MAKKNKEKIMDNQGPMSNQTESDKANESPVVNEVKNPAQELKDLLLRTQANFENYRKQTEKRLAEMEQMASQRIILELLPVIDNFNLALKNADTNSNPQDFLKGIELIYAQFDGLLSEQGVKIIETNNKKFDPFFHEALMKVESDKDENIIIEEFQRGYLLHDKVVRHSKVKVSAGHVRKNIDGDKD
jgi:molecular chaperone GrpE